MKKKLIVGICLCLVCIGVVSVRALYTDDDSIMNMKKIYNVDYQTYLDMQVENKKKDDYTLNNPLILENPYQTSTTSLYLYFHTDEKVKISYTIHADGVEDFSKELYGDYTTEHEYQLIGLVPRKNNTITLTAKNENNEIIDTYEFEYKAPELLSGEDNEYLTVEKGTSQQEVSDGLYTVLGNDTSENDEEIDYIFLYDENGTIRSEIPIISYRSHRLLFDDDMMYYSASSGIIAGMNRLGQITEIINTGEYKLHHDYIYGSQNDFLVLATKKDADTVEDRIISINRDTNEVKELIDLGHLLPQYKNSLSHQDSELDWAHINSIALIDDDSIVISSRETSTIIKIDSIYDNPTIDYMIGSPTFWQESGYDDLLLQQIGNFSLQAGQHCVTYQEDDSLADGQYYLYMYNNNNAICSTRGYDYSKDDYYYDTGKSTTGDQSYYYKYLVDENKRTFELVDSQEVTYSGYVSSVQIDEGNLIVDSGSAFQTVEFDENKEVIQTLIGTGDTWWYRVFKYDYEGYWFFITQ